MIYGLQFWDQFLIMVSNPDPFGRILFFVSSFNGPFQMFLQ